MILPGSAINLRFDRNNNRKIIPKLEDRICSRSEITNYSEFIKRNPLTLCRPGEMLAITAWNVRTLMGVVSQTFTAHTLS